LDRLRPSSLSCGPSGRRRARRQQGREVAMKVKTAFLALAITIPMACEASAATFRFGFQGDLKSLDPYSLNETFTLGLLGNVYEALTKRDKDLKIIPGLAESWEVV